MWNQLYNIVKIPRICQLVWELIILTTVLSSTGDVETITPPQLITKHKVEVILQLRGLRDDNQQGGFGIAKVLNVDFRRRRATCWVHSSRNILAFRLKPCSPGILLDPSADMGGDRLEVQKPCASLNLVIILQYV